MLTSAVAQVTTPELFYSQQSGPAVSIIKGTLRSLRILSSVRRMEPILKGPTTSLMLVGDPEPRTPPLQPRPRIYGGLTYATVSYFLIISSTVCTLVSLAV